MKTFRINGKAYRWDPSVMADNLRPIGYLAATVFCLAAFYFMLICAAALIA